MAVVDKTVDRRGTREVATEYLRHLYSDAGQELAGKHFYRPSNPEFARKYARQFPSLELFTIDGQFGGWEKAYQMHFANNGTFGAVGQKSVRRPTAHENPDCRCYLPVLAGFAGARCMGPDTSRKLPEPGPGAQE